MKQPFGVILAGGQARRMGGGDKALLQLGGTTLLELVIERLEPQVAGLCLNANGDSARFGQIGHDVVADSIGGFVGPLAGVLAGLDWAAEQGAETVVSVAADTPFFPCDLTPRLMMAADNMTHPLALAATDGRHPTFGIWPVALRDDLRAALQGGLRKVVAWTDQHHAAAASFEVGSFDPFFNINTPEDLAQAERYL
ncbi:Molybdenum cofactor guanylyltransferase [Nereida ignava]|uniref:Molybdenum cofactor guanylyltransferase n=1 Tax=Nereida ignava TaxID=282199 RepID=A0A0U1NKZ8_9RHOB|nr:molybdenum cofactor guanylyltransferase MobA [Nereida ignava]CRK75411.1 Molybdenum cofactor guanylyltransferase [Nereida ignava]SFJ53691.1 molybdenum cofactor guanylyltransferase [Nereida ignava DSM 16309]